MVCKYVYVKTFSAFANDIDCNEFHFHDVEIESTGGFLTVYDMNGVIAFRCHINDIAKFMREK